MAYYLGISIFIDSLVYTRLSLTQTYACEMLIL